MESKLEFEILHWRKSVSAIITDRPQDIINREYEEQEYDVFIGIFWKRFGDRQTNGKTPTEEEFERALNGKKKNDKPKIDEGYYLEKGLEQIEAEQSMVKFIRVFYYKST